MKILHGTSVLYLVIVSSGIALHDVASVTAASLVPEEELTEEVSSRRSEIGDLDLGRRGPEKQTSPLPFSPKKEEFLIPEQLAEAPNPVAVEAAPSETEEEVSDKEDLTEFPPSAEAAGTDEQRPPESVPPDEIDAAEKVSFDEPFPGAQETTDEGIWGLQKCIRIALQNAPSLKMARDRIKLAKMKIYEARRDFFPTGFFNYVTGKGVVGGTHYLKGSYRFEAEQPLYAGGRIINTLRKARLDFKISQGKYKEEVDNLAYRACKAYYNLQGAEAVIDLRAQLMRQGSSILDESKKLFSEELVPELELLNVQSQMSQIYITLAKEQQAHSIKRAGLCTAMNVDPSTYFDIIPLSIPAEEEELVLLGDPQIRRLEEYPQLSLSSYIRHALQNRIEFQNILLAIQGKKLEYKIAKAQLLPKVAVYGAIGQLDEAPKDIRDKDLKQEYAGGIKITWPLGGNTIEGSHDIRSDAPRLTSVQSTTSREYNLKVNFLDRLDIYSGMQERAVRSQDALVTLTKVKHKIILEVKEAFFNFRKADISIRAYAEKIKFKEKSLELAKVQKQSGEIQNSDLLRAENELTAEQIGLREAASEYHVKISGLNKAVGKGLYAGPLTEIEDDMLDELLATNEVLDEFNPFAMVDKSDEEVSRVGYLAALDTILPFPGTHKLTRGRNDRSVAILKSNTVNLNDYENKKVSVVGHRIPAQNMDVPIIDVVNVEIIP